MEEISQPEVKKVMSVEEAIEEVRNALVKKDEKKAVEQYKKLQTVYLLMNREDKAKYYKTIVELMSEIKKLHVVLKAT